MGSYPSGANGYARVNPRRPNAQAICDRCGFRYNISDLTWNFEWNGSKLQNQRILVCRRTCLDIPNEQLRSYAVPPDPLPLQNPRPDLSNEGNGPTVVNTVAGSSQTLIGADVTRNQLNFALPPSFGLWLNPSGGTASAGGSGCVFYAPNSYYEAWGAASQSALTYFTTIAGLQIVVQSQAATTPPFPVP